MNILKNENTLYNNIFKYKTLDKAGNNRLLKKDEKSALSSTNLPCNNISDNQFIISEQYSSNKENVYQSCNENKTNEQYCTKLSQQSWSILFLKDLQGAKRKNKYFFDKHIDIYPEYRSVLLDWIIDVCSMYKFYRETCYLAIDYFDCYISLCPKNTIVKSDLLLLGLTSLLIATKVEETKSLPMEDIIYLCDGFYSIKQVLKAEISFIKVLNGKCNPTTANMWLMFFIHIIKRKISSIEYGLCTKLLDTSTLDLEYLKFPGCIIAATCIKLVLLEEVFEYFTHFNVAAKLLKCSIWLKKYWQEILCSSSLSELENQTSNLLSVSDCCPCYPNLTLIQTYSSNLEIFGRVQDNLDIPICVD